MSARIAVAFPFPLERQHIGKDVVQIPASLQHLGFELELHCPVAHGSGWPVPVVEAGPGGLARAAHWRGRDLAGAIAFSFLQHAPLLEAVGAAGACVVAKGDTTGYVLARAHPRRTLEYALIDPAGIGRRATATAYWLARMGPLHRREARQLTRALTAAKVTVVETEGARAAASRALSVAGAPELADRLVVVPNPVTESYLRGEPSPTREKLLVAVGRWQLKVKGADLLGAALERFLRARPDYRAVIVGPSAERVRAGATAARVEHVGPLAREELVALLGRSRIAVSSSWWESFSLASYEALAMGCSLAGPDLAPLRDATAAGPYGTLARARDAGALAAAIAGEAAAWDRGARDPVAASAFWRARLDPEQIARRFAALLELDYPRAGSASARS